MNRVTKTFMGIGLVIVLIVGIIGIFEEVLYVRDEKMIANKEQELIQLKGMVLSKLNIGNLNTMSLVEESYSGLNLDINFDYVSYTKGERMDKYFVQDGEMPDFIVGNNLHRIEIDELIKEGIIVPLNPWIESYAPHLQKLIETDNYFREVITYEDGNIYALPNYSKARNFAVNQYMFINKEWLDVLGLSVPKNTEEFYNILKSFKAGDPNGNGIADEVAFSFVSTGKYRGEHMFLGAFGIADTESYLMKKDGKILFVPMEETYKKGMKYLNQLYVEELIDPQIFTRSYASYYDKKENDIATIGAFIGYTAEDVVGREKASQYQAIVPIRGGIDYPVWMRNEDQDEQKERFVMTVNNKYPERTMSWIDQFYNQDKAFNYYFGEEEKTLKKTEKGYYLMDEYGNNSLWQNILESAPAHQLPGYLRENTYKQLLYDPSQVYFDQLNKMYEPYLYEQDICLYYATEEEIVELEETYNQLSRYIDNMEIRFIADERDIDKEWESFKAALVGIGAESYRGLYEEIDGRCKEANAHKH